MQLETEPDQRPWERFRYHLSRAMHAANGTFDSANAWSWFLGYAALWAFLGILGYAMIEPNGPGGILSLGALSLVAAWLVIFLWRFIFDSPFLLHRTASSNARTSAEHTENVALQNRLIAAQEAHTAAIRAQTRQQADAASPFKQIIDERRREFWSGKKSAPEANLGLIWRDKTLLLAIENGGADAEFDVRIDLTGTTVMARDKGLFPAVWLNAPDAETRRIPETVSEWVIAYEVIENAGMFSASFRYHFGQTIHSPTAHYSWMPRATPELLPQSQRIKMVISAKPRLMGGPKSIEFEVCGFVVRIISGDVLPPYNSTALD